jgi:hypothetical protein
MTHSSYARQITGHALPLLLGLTALAACDQPSDPESDPAAARGVGAAIPPTLDATSIPPYLQTELMSRWNRVVGQSRPVRVGPYTLDFGWKEFDTFPHPTYQGGSEIAYRAFAEVLIAFFEDGETFDLLARNRLFSTPLRHRLESGQVSVWTLEDLTAELAGDSWLDDETRQALRRISDRIGAR